MALHVFYGNAVVGDQRYPRPGLQAEMLRLLHHSAGIKMFALRRIGKSTMTLFAQEAMQKDGYSVIRVDAQGMRSLDGLLFGVFNAIPRGHAVVHRLSNYFTGNAPIPQALRTVIGHALSGASGPDPEAANGIAHYWQPISSQIVSALREERAKMLLTIDELPYLLAKLLEGNKDRGVQQVNDLLAALREWRGAGLKMVLTGSIGMAGLARQYGFSNDHVNDLSDFTVPPLTEEEARGFVVAATHERSAGRWTDEHTEAVLREAGVFYPCFLVKGLLAIGIDHPPPPSEFHEIFADRVRPELHDSFLGQFNRRFKQYRALPDDARRIAIVPMLKQVMQAGPDGCDQSALTASVGDPFDVIDAADFLSVLQEDGFLSYTEARGGARVWRPASSLVRLWWNQAGL
jgi:hypothetical protein